MNQKDEIKHKEIQAGLVMVSAFIIITSVVLILSKGKVWFRDQTEMQIYFSDVQGLKVGDPVQIMGMEKGIVRKIYLAQVENNEASYVRKEMKVVVEAEINVLEEFSKDTEISIDRSLTGQTVLKIRPGNLTEMNKSYKFWGTDNSSYIQLAQKGGVIVDQIDQFVAKIVKGNGANSMLESFKNLQEFTHDLKDQGPHFSNFFAQMFQLTENLNYVTKESKEDLVKTLKNFHQVSLDLKDLTKNANVAMGNVLQASTDIKSLAHELRWKPWIMLNKPDKVELKNHDLTNGIQDLRESLNKLQQMIDKQESKDGKKELIEKMNQLKIWQKQIEIEQSLR